MTALTEHPDSATAASDDHFGAIETAGVEYVPEEARDSRPRNLGAVFLGANLTWTNVVFGAFAILFGLSFWQTLTSMAVGTAIGTLAVLPTALIGPRTGTNMTVSSGAFFGIRGRFIGSFLALAIALAFAAVTVWTSGDALVAGGHRLFGTPDTSVVHGVAYALVAALMVVVALYGHATIVAMQKLVVPVVGTLMVLGFFAFAGSVDVNAPSGEYALGGFWQTWALSAVLFAAAPISYGPTIGDYTRRISSIRFSDKQICGALGIGMFVGVMLPSLFGAVTALSFANPTDSYLDDLVNASPAWFVVPIIVISLLGGLSQGVLCVYASGLDLEGLTPRLKRTQTTVITAAVAIVLLYLGVFVFNAVESVTAMTIALNAVITPWVAILAIGALTTRTYDPIDLQAFAQNRRGGRYWFTGGWNIPAVVAWTVGAVFGVLTVNTALYVGPLAELAGGVDLSTMGFGRIGGVDLRGILAPKEGMTEHQVMTRSAEDIVTEFCSLWANPDPEELATWFTDDAVYHNIPMPPAEGREAIKEFIAGFTGAFDGIDFKVHRQVSAGDVVMNERTDVMRKKGGGEVALPVMGVFEVRDGKIAVWRDYFDLATVTAAFG